MYQKCKLKTNGSDVFNLFVLLHKNSIVLQYFQQSLVSTCFFTLSVLMVKSIAIDL